MAVKLAVDLGAKVINMSFGTDDSALAARSPKPHADVVDYALARGCILVAASGNNGRTTRYWPAAYPGVIAVGAVGDDRRPTSFSTRGEHVALSAPGEQVLTTALNVLQRAPERASPPPSWRRGGPPGRAQHPPRPGDQCGDGARHLMRTAQPRRRRRGAAAPAFSMRPRRSPPSIRNRPRSGDHLKRLGADDG